MNERENMCRRRKWMEENSLDKTKTTTFILPTLGYTPKWYGDGLINCYITGGRSSPNIVLIFDLNFNEHSTEILLKLDGNENYLRSYIDVDELVYEFKIPDKFKQDFNHFINGDYSKFTKLLKDVLDITYGKDHLVHAVIYPEVDVITKICKKLGVDKLPKNEVFSIIDNNEYYKQRNELEVKEQEVSGV